MRHIGCSFLWLILLTGLTALTALTGVKPAWAQVVLFDSTDTIQMEPILITGSRIARTLSNFPVPLSMISLQKIESVGAIRISDILSQESGLIMTGGVGYTSGIQLQGFSPEYTLILIDGQPIIGRVSGTLDLNRLTVNNIDHIEIIRGPASAIYGSEALAGVINIITKKTDQSFAGTLNTQIESHNVYNLSATTSLQNKKLGFQLDLSRFSAGGFDLTPKTLGNTSPEFVDYTLASKLNVNFSPSTTLTFNARLNDKNIENETQLSLNLANDEKGYEFIHRTDWQISGKFTTWFSTKLKSTTEAYFSHYQTRFDLADEVSSPILSSSTFKQFYGKGETYLNLVFDKHLFSAGGGFVFESVNSDRIRNTNQIQKEAYFFGEYEWIPTVWLDLITAGRLDYHSEYQLHFSPKISAMLKAGDTARLRLSVGSGFKAPSFQQLYLDFTNPSAGYNVIGSSDLHNILQQQNTQGLITRFIQDPAGLDAVDPESSIAYNVGIEWQPKSTITAKVNLFYNAVDNLIEAAPVAVKTNGQTIYSYFNLNSIFTRGVETNLHFPILSNIQINLGYQFLDAKDNDVLDKIEAGQLYKRIDGRDRRVTTQEYGGLMNRSRHTATASLLLALPKLDFTLSIRGQFRGRYGYSDMNGNLILDDDTEYVSGAQFWHLTFGKGLGNRLGKKLGKKLGNAVKVQAGVRNIFNHTNPAFTPWQAGRLFFAGIKANF